MAGTDLATATLRDGSFTLSNVPAGSQSLARPDPPNVTFTAPIVAVG